MLVKLSDLKGPEVFLEIEGKRYQLSGYTLGVEAWCYKEFATEQEKNGLKNLNERLSNIDVKAFVMVAYAMIMDKADFTTFDAFYKKLKNIKGAFELIQIAVIKSMREALPDVVQDPDVVKKKIWMMISLIELIGLMYLIFSHPGIN